MTDQGVVFDLGYKPHDGPRLGRGAAVRATIRDGIRRVLGLRRKARKKILPWALFAIALLPAVVFVGLVFLTSQLGAGDVIDTVFASHATYFNVAASTVLLFCALAGPELLVPDRVDGVLNVYSSRPLTVRDYLLARGAALAIVVAGFMLLPQMLLYLGLAALRSGGFVSNLVATADEIPKLVAVAAAYLVAYGAPALLVAVLTRRLAAATGIYVGLMFGLEAVAAGLSESGTRLAGLLALIDHPSVVRDWVYGQTSELIPTDAGLEPAASLAVIVGVLLVTALVAARRYRTLM